MVIGSPAGSVAVLSAIRALYAATDRFPEAAHDALTALFGPEGVVGFVACSESCLHRFGEDAPAPDAERFAGGSRIEWHGDSAVLCADHGAPGRSVWVLRAPQRGVIRRFGSAVLGNLAQAGQLNLPDTAGADACLLQRATAPAPPAPSPEVVDDLLMGLGADAHAAVRLAARGYSNRLIGEHLGLSVAAVSRRLRVAYAHLGIAGRPELPLASLVAMPEPPARRAVR